MAREIILTAVQVSPIDGSLQAQGVFWLTAPANHQQPNPGLVSAVPLAAAVSWGASAAEVSALQSGAIVEQPFNTGFYAAGTTVAQIQADLISRFTVAQTALTALNPTSKFVGASWNGSTWVAGSS